MNTDFVKSLKTDNDCLAPEPHKVMASNINQIKRSALVYVKEIGEGAFSNVYQMTWDSPDGPIDVAAKKLRRRDIHELEVLSGLVHPNIVKLIGVVDEEMDFMLILELCEGGSLRSYLKKRQGNRLSEKQFYDWAEQAARPLEYLTQNKWVHKDVKSPNYMVTSHNTLKLGDFGLAKNIDQTIDNATETASYQWMAPELLAKGVLSPKYDIFALAVVLWELWTGKFPWEGLESQVVAWKVCHKNERLPIPEDCPGHIRFLLRHCWQTDWHQRPNIDQVLLVITTHPTVAAKEARQMQIIAGPWELARTFGDQVGPGKLVDAYGIGLSPDGNVVIADDGASKIRIYSLGGKYKSSIHIPHGLQQGKRSRPFQVTVNSDNTYFLTDLSEHIRKYQVCGHFRNQWVSSCPRASSYSPCLEGLAMGHTGDLLVGDCKNNYINRYKQDATHLGSIKVGIEPTYIAVTSQDTVIVADWYEPPQIVSNTGQVMHILQHPVRSSLWDPRGVYCQEDIIFVANRSTHNILCYTEYGKYLGPIPIPPVERCELAMTSDLKTLLVCESRSVKVFTSSTQQ